jgi:hypothetical protein
VLVRGIVIRVMRFRVGMRMIVERLSMPVFVGMDDNLSGGLAAAAILSADLSRPPAFGTRFPLVERCFLVHRELLSFPAVR